MDIIRESSLIQQFKQEGREEGIGQGIQESIQEVLEICFGMSETHPLFARIAAIEDLQRLKQLHRTASLDEFKRLLDATV